MKKQAGKRARCELTKPFPTGSTNEASAASLELGSDRHTLTAVYNDHVCLQVRHQWLLESTKKTSPVNTENPEKIRRPNIPSAGLTWIERSKTPALLFEYSWQSGPHIDFSVRISNQGTEPVALCLVQNIIGIPLQGLCFAPSMQSIYDLKQSGVAFAYRGTCQPTESRRGGGLSIPMVCFYERSRDIGFTIAGHIESPTPPFFCEMDPGMDCIAVRRKILGLNPGNSTTINQFIIRHEGCWRPGLRWVRDTYSDYFMVPAQLAEATHGCFVYSNTVDEALCDEFARENVKNVEIHYTPPFFGKSIPEEEPWIKMMDDKWNTVKLTTDPDAPGEDAPYEDIKRYMSRVVKPTGTRAAVQNFIRNLKTRGIRSYIYFLPTEAWEFFANREFPENILRRSDGSPCMTWFDHVRMDCRPDSRWGQYMRDQLERLLEMYPEVDGIFMDQAAGDDENCAISRLSDVVGEVVKRKGKMCYWNGPYMVDLLKHAMGLLGELGPIQGEAIKWLAIGNKVCCGMGHTEAQYQRNFLNGLWPAAPALIHARGFRMSDSPAQCKPIPAKLERLHSLYMHLYELLPGKTWFLGPNPLEVPEGVQGNMFERPNGEYLVSLIVPGHDIADGPYASNFSVSVHAPGLDRIRGVYLRSVNLPGKQYKVPFHCRDNRLHITIPWIGSSSMLWLTRETLKADEMPEAASGTIIRRTQKSAPRIICARINSEGMAPTGNLDSMHNGLTTTAPMPHIPVRKAYLNGLPIGSLYSVNSRHWHPHVGVGEGLIKGITADITDVLRRKNELVIEPDGPEDFFKIRNITLVVVFSDGRSFNSKPETNTYSSCPHTKAEGIIRSPIRIPIEFYPTDMPG